MKKRNLITAMIWMMTIPVMLNAQDAKLEVEDGAVLFRGTTGSTPVSGFGTRLMWIPDKAAFRVGLVYNTEWDASNIGHRSFASGTNTTASGTSSFVGGGLGNTASNSYAFVGGGQDNIASGSRAFVASGENNVAGGSSSFVGGGSDNLTSGSRSFIGGGTGLLARSYGEAVFGTFNTDYTPNSPSTIRSADRLFVIGNGTETDNRSNAVTVLKNGRVGIGADNPSAQLQVVSNSTTDTAQIHIIESGANDFARINFTNQDIANKQWTIAARSHTMDDQSFLNFYYLGMGNILSLKGDGDATLMGSLTENSDRTLKENIVHIDHVIPSLLQLKAYRYDWKYLNKDRQIGFIAQEVREIYPELVKENEDGILSVNYTKFVPLLIEAIKEQQTQIESLTTLNKTLGSEIEHLKSMEVQLAQITSALAELGVTLAKVP